MNARKKPAHVSDQRTTKTEKIVSGKRNRGPREDDKVGTKSTTAITEPIQRDPDGREGTREPEQPIIREPDEPETKPSSTIPPIDRPDHEEES